MGTFLESDDNASNIDSIDINTSKVLEQAISGNNILTNIELTLNDTQNIQVSGNNILTNVNVELQLVNSSLGTEGSTPPTITGSGIIGWLRGIYEKLFDVVTVSVDNFPTSTPGLTDAELRASPVPVSVEGLNITIPSGTTFVIDLTDTNTLIATGNDVVSKIDINLGQQDDAMAANNIGTFSFISLFKRLLEKIDLITDSLSIFGGTLDSGFTLDYLFQSQATSQLQVSGIDILNSIDTKLDLISASGVNIKSFKSYRGKEVTVSGSNVVNDIKINYSELFFYDIVQDIWLEFPENIQISFTSDDNVDTDYRTILSEKSLNITGISISNIKIKSQNLQTGFIYTAGF